MVPLVQDTSEGWAAARKLVLQGNVVAFPTDTVYGIGCDPFSEQAIERIYAIKGRPDNKALPLLLADPKYLSVYASDYSPLVERLAGTLWPGALTLVLRTHRALPHALTINGKIGLRVPAHEQLRDFLRSCGGALAVTSANLSGSPEALNAYTVVANIGEGLSLVIDGGPSGRTEPSTVLDCTVDPPLILRQGAVAKARIDFVLADRGEL